MSSLVIGVIGHVDHGKTALVRALTGEETDRLAEEKARGISIALGFARLPGAAGAVIDLIDMPGHEKFVRTMIAGAGGIDAVLLVLAANEGVKPQTIEHIDIAGLLGIGQAVLAISKTDLATPEQAQLVAGQGKALLEKAGMVVAPAVFTSALNGEGIEALRATLLGLAGAEKPQPGQGQAYMPVDRAFAIAGHGPVVTGTLRGGAVAAGDVLTLWPARKEVRVRAVQSHGEKLPLAPPGRRVALNLRGAELAELKPGMALAAPGALAPSLWLSVLLRAVAGAPALKNGVLLRALLGTEELDVRLRLLEGDVLAPGETGFVQLHCTREVAVPARTNLVLRLTSPARTVAGGRILEPVTRRLRRRSPAVLARLAMLAQLPPDELVLAEIAARAAAGVRLGELAALSALAPAHIEALLKTSPVRLLAGGIAVHQPAFDSLLARLPAVLAGFEEGLSPARLLNALPGTGAEVLEEAIRTLLARNILRRDGTLITLPRPEQDRARARNEADLDSEIAGLLQNSGLSPPDPKTILTSLAAKRAVDRLLREGRVVRAKDRAKDKEILFHQDAIAQAVRKLAPLLEQGPGLLATDIGAVLGISRKYTMPLLDHLDEIRFTRRVADRRLRGTASLAALLSGPTSV